METKMQYGIDFGTGITTETVFEFVDGMIEILLELDFPVLPKGLPIELKGIAV